MPAPIHLKLIFLEGVPLSWTSSCSSCCVVMKKLSFPELVARGDEAVFNFFLTYGEMYERIYDFENNAGAGD